MGGKTRIGKKLASIIQSFNPVRYHEPFCGMFSVGKHIICEHRTAGDIHPDLILMLKAVQDGWIPPTGISEKDYQQLRDAEPSALRGFVGFGCSFYGKFFGGFARGNYEDFSDLASRTLIKLAPYLKTVEFKNESYINYAGGADVIYCDPPYAGTTNFSPGEFNFKKFWDWVRRRKEIVLVSEYTAPSDFKILWEKSVTTTMRNTENRGCARIEKLFVNKPA